MSQSLPPEDIASAAQTQIEQWRECREVMEERGTESIQGTTPPLVLPDETVGNHEYDEVDAEQRRRGEKEKPEVVKKVTEVNDSVREDIPSINIGSNANLWETIAETGRGAYTGTHPVFKTDGLYLYGCPHVLIFEDGKPVRVIRLRGTKYYYREDPYSNHLVGPWVTCRILERSRFDVSELEITHIRYKRPENGERGTRQKELLQQIEMAYAGVGDFSNVNPESAVDIEDINIDTYEYRSRFEYNSVDFNSRLRRSKKLIKGEVESRRES
jgi:hypothetical protein